MRQQEAEEAAAKRNREDPHRDRFVFYALDESAGLASDAWDVGMRLRRDDERPRRQSRARRPSTPAPRASATAVIEPELLAAEPVPGAFETLEAPTEVFDGAVESVAPPAPAPAPASDAAPAPRRRRFGIVRLWGVFVVLVGLVFIAAVLVVAIRFRDYTHLGTVTWGIGVLAGLLAVWVGVVLARRRN